MFEPIFNEMLQDIDYQLVARSKIFKKSRQNKHIQNVFFSKNLDSAGSYRPWKNYSDICIRQKK